ncbi:hypothetical protein Goari_014330 [Gossypium aridum]|uniref:Uncharacterized protein n=1 Tax=Gossypium aridum TaxID=34290 RepID=A0A7J8XIL4_GOSAI|nr:hypothetical protein [Gossypium aridum]
MGLMSKGMEGFCPVQLTLGSKEVVLGWNNFLRALPRRVSMMILSHNLLNNHSLKWFAQHNLLLQCLL